MSETTNSQSTSGSRADCINNAISIHWEVEYLIPARNSLSKQPMWFRMEINDRGDTKIKDNTEAERIYRMAAANASPGSVRLVRIERHLETGVIS